MVPPDTVPGSMGARMGISAETLRKWRAKRKYLPYVRVGRHIRYKACDVAAFIERGVVDVYDGGKR